MERARLVGEGGGAGPVMGEGRRKWCTTSISQEAEWGAGEKEERDERERERKRGVGREIC